MKSPGMRLTELFDTCNVVPEGGGGGCASVDSCCLLENCCDLCVCVCVFVCVCVYVCVCVCV